MLLTPFPLADIAPPQCPSNDAVTKETHSAIVQLTLWVYTLISNPYGVPHSQPRVRLFPRTGISPRRRNTVSATGAELMSPRESLVPLVQPLITARQKFPPLLSGVTKEDAPPAVIRCYEGGSSPRCYQVLRRRKLPPLLSGVTKEEAVSWWSEDPSLMHGTTADLHGGPATSRN